MPGHPHIYKVGSQDAETSRDVISLHFLEVLIRKTLHIEDPQFWLRVGSPRGIVGHNKK
jgi:hypothetical protein